jgi:3-oxoacyl-ACP reductase-like protein
MKKTLSIIALSVIGFGMVSCKKENKETATGSETAAMTADSANATAPAPMGDSAAAPATEQTAAAATASKQPLTTIALSESNFDFGKIKKGDKVQHVYEVTNTGSNPLVISEVKPGCGCTVPDFTKDPIMPGKKGKITLHFDSSNFDGNVSKFADVFANVEKMPVKLTFTANIQP